MKMIAGGSGRAFLIAAAIALVPPAGLAAPVYDSALARFGAASWAAGGAQVAEIGQPTAAFTNPAGLGGGRPTIYLEAGKRFAAGGPNDLEWDGQLVVPGFASLTWPVGAGGLAVAYARTYDLRIRSEPRFETTHPEGGEPYFENRTVAHSWLAAGGRPFGRRVRAGLAGGLTYLRVKETISGNPAEDGALGWLAVAGIAVSLSDGLDAGAVFRTMSEIEHELRWPGIRLRTSAEFPWTVEAGLGCRMSRRARLLAGLEWQRWMTRTEGGESTVEIHGGVEVTAGAAVIGLGAFTQAGPEERLGTTGDQGFLTAGVRAPLSDRLSLAATLLDSHAFGNASRLEQTHLLIGVAFR